MSLKLNNNLTDLLLSGSMLNPGQFCSPVWTLSSQVTSVAVQCPIKAWPVSLFTTAYVTKVAPFSLLNRLCLILMLNSMLG